MHPVRRCKNKLKDRIIETFLVIYMTLQDGRELRIATYRKYLKIVKSVHKGHEFVLQFSSIFETVPTAGHFTPPCFGAILIERGNS